MDPSAVIDAVRREVRDTIRDGQPARMIVAERTYAAPPDDVWDALTNRERIPRWFMPITGELRPGGRYQLEGNAGGDITTCEPPRHLAVTWEFGGSVTWLDVYLVEDGDDTTVRLEHVAAPDDDEGKKWDGEFGPGAVGVGWDLGILALGEHLASGANVTESDPADPAMLDAMRRSSEAWGQAAIAHGTPRDVAEAAAARTTAFYTGG